MQINKISDMTNGWFIGNFSPSLIKTELFEIAYKQYKAGDSEQSHYHKIATETTLIAYGKAKMNNIILYPGTIVTIEPNESTDFVAIEDTATVVIKIPSIQGDKYNDINIT